MTSIPFGFKDGGSAVHGTFALSGGGRSPLVVTLHGGSYTSKYFDIRGYSLVRTMTANGISVLSVDRPGYARSALAGGRVDFTDSARMISSALEAAWGEYTAGSSGARCPGIVLVGHSVGAAIAVHVAAGDPQFPLLGLSIHGVGAELQPGVGDGWAELPTDEPFTFTQQLRAALMYGPETTRDADVIEVAEAATAPTPLAEMLEITGRWLVDVNTLAGQVRVPVHYTMGGLDQLWVVDDQKAAAFARRFDASSQVLTSVYRGAGHNIDHHWVGPAFHLDQASFALRCAALR